MKRYKYIMVLFVLGAFVSCEEVTNSAEKSDVTYLPVIELEGESEIELACNASGFTDPGAAATEGGEAIELSTVLTGQYFGGSLVGGEWVYSSNTTVSGPDVYEYYYSAENVDGIPAVAFRHVYVPACQGDLITSIAGTYSSSLVRTSDPGGAAAGTYTDVGPIMIKSLGGNEYQISDALGGWYAFGRAFGYTGAAPGMTITATSIPTNTFTFGAPVFDQTFGGKVTMTSLTVDPIAGTLVFKCDWDLGYKFVYTLKPI